MKRYLISFISLLVCVMSFAQLNAQFDYGQDGHVYFYFMNSTQFHIPLTIIARNAQKNQSYKDKVTIWSGNTFIFGPNLNWLWEKGESMTVIDASGQSYNWVCPYTDPYVLNANRGYSSYNNGYNHPQTNQRINSNNRQNVNSNTSNYNNYNNVVDVRTIAPKSGNYPLSPFPTVSNEEDKRQKEEYYKSIAKNYAVNGRDKVPNPIPTKPLATINDFPVQTNRYETNDHLKIITIDIKRYNNYQKAYVKVSDVYGPEYGNWDFMVCADGTLLEDPSEYTAFKNSKNLNFTLKLNKGYRTVTFNGQIINKVSRETLQNKANNEAAMSQIQHEINMMYYNSQKGSGSNTQQGKSPERRNYTSCNACGGLKFEKQRYNYAPTSTSGWAQPHHNPYGRICSICNNSSEHYHHPCNTCHGFGHL